MKPFYIIYGFALLSHLIFMMSLLVRWGVGIGDRDKLSDMWHLHSVIFRAGVAVLWVVTLLPDLILLSSLAFPYLLFTYVLWDGFIAIALGQSWWYIGNTSKWDKWWNVKISKVLKLIIVVMSVASVFFYLFIK